MTTLPDLIIFDCDGVLVDSEHISDRVFCEVLSEAGFLLTPGESGAMFTGFSMKSCIEIAEQHFGKKLPSDILDRYYERVYAAFRAELKPVVGAPEVVRAVIDRGIPVCVASSSSHATLRVTLGVTGLLPLFEGAIFSSQDVKRGKPFPDLFLYAAERMGAAFEKCVVVEDSVPGAKAGIAACMRVLGHAAVTPQEKLAEVGAEVFVDMKEVMGIL